MRIMWMSAFLQQTEAGLKVEDIDIYEINEAFASQATMCLGVVLQRFRDKNERTTFATFCRWKVGFLSGEQVRIQTIRIRAVLNIWQTSRSAKAKCCKT